MLVDAEPFHVHAIVVSAGLARLQTWVEDSRTTPGRRDLGSDAISPPGRKAVVGVRGIPRVLDSYLNTVLAAHAVDAFDA